jgi:MFS family permease
MFNVVYFFSLIGLNNAFTANVIVYSVLLGGVLASFYLIDKVGRRPLLLGGCAFMSVCVFAVGGIGFTDLGPSAGNAMVALVAMWVAAYSVSIAPIGWVALVEMSTPTLRTQTAGVAALMQSCVNVLFNYTVPLMLSAQYAGWGAKIGLFFGPLAALSVIALFFLFPETKNRSYAELDELFARKISARKFGSTKTAINDAADLLEAQEAGVPKLATV